MGESSERRTPAETAFFNDPCERTLDRLMAEHATARALQDKGRVRGKWSRVMKGSHVRWEMDLGDERYCVIPDGPQPNSPDEEREGVMLPPNRPKSGKTIIPVKLVPYEDEIPRFPE